MVRLPMMKGVNFFSNHTYVKSVSGNGGVSGLVPGIVIKSHGLGIFARNFELDPPLL